MPETPASPAPGRDGNPVCVPSWPEWMDDPAYLAARDVDLDRRYADPDDDPPPDVDDAELAAETAAILAAGERRAAVLAGLGLAETRTAAADILALACELEVNLPGTRAAFRGGPQDQEPATPQERSGRADPAQSPDPAPGGPPGGVIPPGFAGYVNLTIPAATVLGLVGRPGDLGGIGPVDPDLARDLAAAAARNPRSTWCLTVTDRDGHAVAHGCARPVKRRKRDGHDLPGRSHGFALVPAGQHGTWRFTAGDREMLISIEPLPGPDCDHRHQARGHDPGGAAPAPDPGPPRHLMGTWQATATRHWAFGALGADRGACLTEVHAFLQPGTGCPV